MSSKGLSPATADNAALALAGKLDGNHDATELFGEIEASPERQREIKHAIENHDPKTGKVPPLPPDVDTATGEVQEPERLFAVSTSVEDVERTIDQYQERVEAGSLARAAYDKGVAQVSRLEDEVDEEFARALIAAEKVPGVDGKKATEAVLKSRAEIAPAVVKVREALFAARQDLADKRKAATDAEARAEVGKMDHFYRMERLKQERPLAQMQSNGIAAQRYGEF